ncbi:hypothetical protein HZB01_04110 [Candidatus Woesearchaeota archaeon]|nr:hypothetical protein [Candidatus Woesearchaeota archaeon]
MNKNLGKIVAYAALVFGVATLGDYVNINALNPMLSGQVRQRSGQDRYIPGLISSICQPCFTSAIDAVNQLPDDKASAIFQKYIPELKSPQRYALAKTAWDTIQSDEQNALMGERLKRDVREGKQVLLDESRRLYDTMKRGLTDLIDDGAKDAR